MKGWPDASGMLDPLQPPLVQSGAPLGSGRAPQAGLPRSCCWGGGGQGPGSWSWRRSQSPSAQGCRRRAALEQDKEGEYTPFHQLFHLIRLTYK